jgi:hypothetical protein
MSAALTAAELAAHTPVMQQYTLKDFTALRQ